ncbi:MAG: hypothetical protein HYX32_13355 [Actinobacteria bacterium]|nr:hypothetical protein [Actinomycetota bacterium]
MFIACWSAKGGSGTTVVAAGLGLILSDATRARGASSRSKGRAGQPPRPVAQALPDLEEGDALLVDLGGDLPAVLGLPEPNGPGIADWLAAGRDVPADGLARIEIAAAPGLSIVPRGSGPLSQPPRAEMLAGLLAADGRHVIVDCGRLDAPGELDRGPNAHDEAAEVVRTVVSSASQSLLVTRSCYLSLRRYLRLSVQPSGIVLLTERGRSLSALDVEEVCNAPVVAEVALDLAVARAVDSGLLSQRVPRGLARALLRAA